MPPATSPRMGQMLRDPMGELASASAERNARATMIAPPLKKNRPVREILIAAFYPTPAGSLGAEVIAGR